MWIAIAGSGSVLGDVDRHRGDRNRPWGMRIAIAGSGSVLVGSGSPSRHRDRPWGVRIVIESSIDPRMTIAVGGGGRSAEGAGRHRGREVGLLRTLTPRTLRR